jgi:hypothetical protein
MLTKNHALDAFLASARAALSIGPLEDAVEGAQRFLIDSGVLLRYLQALLTNEDLLRTVHGRSSFHANGFDRLILFRESRCSRTLRLHIFPPEPSGIPDIHNHNWDFGSLLLCGRYTAEYYAQQAAPAAVPHLHYLAHSGQQGSASYAIEFVDIVPLVLTSRETWSAGGGYVLDRTRLHRVRPNTDTLTASLVIHGPYTKYASDVYREAGLTATKACQMPRREPQDLLTIVSALVSRISQ